MDQHLYKPVQPNLRTRLITIDLRSRLANIEIYKNQWNQDGTTLDTLILASKKFHTFDFIR